ncbi:MAG: glycerate kinase [Bowdeniella nasicola]|nr:glycerate kinase [Bowdeniella nasicola]
MRALVVGPPPATTDFLRGWQANSHDPALALSGVELLYNPGAPLMQLADPPHILVSQMGTTFASTAPFAIPLAAVAAGDLGPHPILLAGPSLHHDGGAGAWRNLSVDQRNRLTHAAGQLTIAPLRQDALLGVHARSSQLAAISGDQHRGAGVDRAISNFYSAHQWVYDTGELLRIARQPGTAMAGGVVMLLAALGASVTPAVTALCEYYNWPKQLTQADVVIILSHADSAEVTVDPVITEVAKLAAAAILPCAVVARDHQLPRRTFASLGVSDLYTRGNRSWKEMGAALAQTWR